MTLRLRPWAAACALPAAMLLAAPPGHAAAAGVFLKDIQITLVDLDQDDGVVPAVRTQPTGYVVRNCFPCGPGEGSYPAYYWTMPRIGSSDPVAVVSRSDTPAGKIDAYFAPDEFGASLVSNGTDAWLVFDSIRVGFFDGTYGRGSFDITAHTQVTITGTLVAYAGDGDSAQGTVQWGTIDSSTGTYRKELGPLVTASSAGQGMVTAPFSFSTRNTVDWTVSPEFWIEMGAWMHASPPVPEPEALPLAGLGLALLAGARRIRQPR